MWDLAAAISVGSWPGIVLGLGQRPGIQVRMRTPKPDAAVSLARDGPGLVGIGAAGHLTCPPGRCRLVVGGSCQRAREDCHAEDGSGNRAADQGAVPSPGCPLAGRGRKMCSAPDATIGWHLVVCMV
jgi:hypothetical protein